MSTSLILVIDDEPQIQRFLKIALVAQGYEVVLCQNAEQGLAEIALQSPALVILDLGLPDLPGLEVLRQLRSWSRVPVVILSVQDQESEKVAALDLGADDYLTKPFGVPELLARIRVALRHAAERSQTDVAPQLQCGPLLIDRPARSVSLQGQPVKLTKTEFNLLEYLALHAGKVVTHRQLLTALWGAEYFAETHYLQVYISQLRRKLEADPTQPQLLLTEPGVGYRLSDVS